MKKVRLLLARQFYHIRASNEPDNRFIYLRHLLNELLAINNLSFADIFIVNLPSNLIMWPINVSNLDFKESFIKNCKIKLILPTLKVLNYCQQMLPREA